MRIWKSVVQQWFMLSVLAGVCMGFSAQAQYGQWVPVGPPPWTNTSIQTIGGVTYFTHTSWLRNTERVTSGPVSRQGMGLSQMISEEVWVGIEREPGDHIETHVSVLGALPPGDYHFSVSSFNADLGWAELFAEIDFSVSASETPTVSSWISTNTATFNLSVAGVPNVTYVIQVSDTLTNWTSLATNVGGPFVWSEPLRPEVTNRFYRTRIIGN